MKRLLLLALFTALPLAAAAPNVPLAITVSPSSPKAGDSVVVTIHGINAEGCSVGLKSAKLASHQLTVDAVTSSPCAACPAVLAPYSFSTPPFVLSDAFPYTIEYGIVDCLGNRKAVATKAILVTPKCSFDRSLTVSASSFTAGDTASFSWCDPSFSPFPDGGQSATAYRIYLVRPGEAPILVHERNTLDIGNPFFGATIVANVRFADTDAGATGAFVEADMCQITIAGCRDAFTLRSNVVPLTIAANDVCTFAGNAVCLNGRFSVTTRWSTANQSSPGHPVALTTDTGSFWFFSPDNVELVVKMVDACSTPTPRFWFFAAGLTDVGVEIVVKDTKTGQVKRYTSQRGTAFQPIQDTNAFATCSTP